MRTGASRSLHSASPMPYIAARLQGEVEGDGTRLLTGLASAEAAREGDLKVWRHA